MKNNASGSNFNNMFGLPITDDGTLGKLGDTATGLCGDGADGVDVAPDSCFKITLKISRFAFVRTWNSLLLVLLK